MDCEMVGAGPAGEDSIAARVSVVNQFGKCVYDKYIKPTQQVTDYRTAVSGIRPENLKQGGSCAARGLRRGKQEGAWRPLRSLSWGVDRRGPGWWLPGGSHAHHGFASVPLSRVTPRPGHWPRVALCHLAAGTEVECV